VLQIVVPERVRSTTCSGSSVDGESQTVTRRGGMAPHLLAGVVTTPRRAGAPPTRAGTSVVSPPRTLASRLSVSPEYRWLDRS